jgi:hypothetical protein
LATLRTDIPLFDNVDQLQWNGPSPTFTAFAARLDAAAQATGDTSSRVPAKRLRTSSG